MDINGLVANHIEKLKKRFPNGFTLQDAGRNGKMIDWNKK